ncbi:hypothetical protein GCM10009754_14590 [Amycolatopsis minnesotensis]|uniref:Uncharacterized protein n=1 Tax=Amycolatopsis minnesotensis TaxID=337894 RepID=A0ABN2Q993_9PSEU
MRFRQGSPCFQHYRAAPTERAAEPAGAARECPFVRFRWGTPDFNTIAGHRQKGARKKRGERV